MEEIILALQQIALVLSTSLFWLELQAHVSPIYALLNLISCVVSLS